MVFNDCPYIFYSVFLITLLQKEYNIKKIRLTRYNKYRRKDLKNNSLYWSQKEEPIKEVDLKTLTII